MGEVIGEYKTKAEITTQIKEYFRTAIQDVDSEDVIIRQAIRREVLKWIITEDGKIPLGRIALIATGDDSIVDGFLNCFD